MKELMFVAIGLGSGFAICGCLMFYVMACLAKCNAKKNNYDVRTIELMEERNRIDDSNRASLQDIAESLRTFNKP